MKATDRTREDLTRLLHSIDHRGYPAYKETRGRWSYGSYILSIDHVQGDPFASPSSVSVLIPAASACLPEEFLRESHRRIALQDHLLRVFGREISGRERSSAGSGKSGQIFVSRPGQEILERTACRIDPATGDVTVRFAVGFPANGRSINAGELIRLLNQFLPEAVSSLFYPHLNHRAVRSVIDLSDDQQAIRQALPALGLCSFVADGAVLPRQSGVSSLPMKDAVPFRSPDSLAVTLTLPHKGSLRGMGIRKGVTLIVGGGYHGKSTLLSALEKGVYSHIAGDGREYVITDENALKIRAEDGRSIAGTNISPFISHLPNGKDTLRFTTEDASGSTSQAAGVMEAVEAGASVLLMDEDTSATNFMVRDELMASVVSREKEPITPFISRIRELYDDAGISTILCAGSSGSFFVPADTIIQMDNYLPREITAEAKAQAALFHETPPSAPRALRAASSLQRIPLPKASLRREERLKLKVLSDERFLLSREEVDVRALEQIVDREQTASLAYALKYLQLHILDGKKTFPQACGQLMQLLASRGLEELFDGAVVAGGLAGVRPLEVCSVLSRYRGLTCRQP